MPETIFTTRRRIEGIVEELLGAGPGDLHRLAADLREARRLERLGVALLPPKPPPRNGVMTRTCSESSPSARATRSRVGNGVCVEAQTVSRAAVTSASAACGSIGAWAT